jgi:hypothetical protein
VLYSNAVSADYASNKYRVFTTSPHFRWPDTSQTPLLATAPKGYSMLRVFHGLQVGVTTTSAPAETMAQIAAAVPAANAFIPRVDGAQL